MAETLISCVNRPRSEHLKSKGSCAQTPEKAGSLTDRVFSNYRHKVCVLTSVTSVSQFEGLVHLDTIKDCIDDDV